MLWASFRRVPFWLNLNENGNLLVQKFSDLYQMIILQAIERSPI